MTEPTAADVVNLAEEIGKGAREFNQLQAGYRKLASTWLIAAFGALGYLLLPDGGGQPDPGSALSASIPRLMVAVGLASYIGIIILWLVDVRLYHRLLLSYFDAGCALEEEYGFLPKIRQGMRGSPATFVATVYYVLLATAAPVAAWLGVSANAGEYHPDAWLLSVLVLDLLILIWGVRDEWFS